MVYMVFVLSIIGSYDVLGYVGDIKLTKRMLGPGEKVSELVDKALLYLYCVQKGYLDSIADEMEYREKDKVLKASYSYFILNRVRVNEGEIYSVYRKRDVSKEVIAIDCKTLKDALRAYRELLEGKEWLEVLKKYGTDPKLKREKGRIGLIKWQYYPDILTRIVFRLKEGSISLPFRYKGKWYVVKVVKEKRNEIGPYDKERARIKREISYKKTRRLVDSHLNKIRFALNIKFNDNVLKYVYRKIPRNSRKSKPTIFPDSLQSKVIAYSSMGPFTIRDFQRITIIERRSPSIRNIEDLKDYIKWKITVNGLYVEAVNRGLTRTDALYSSIMKDRFLKVLSLFRNIETSRLKVSEDTLRNFYNTHKNLFSEPEKRLVYVLVMEDKDKLMDVKRKILKEDNFESFAKKYSIHYTKSKGGKIGWITKDKFGKIGEMAFKTQKGKISDVFKFNKNWAIVKVADILESKVPPFEKIRGKVDKKYRENVFEKKKKQIVEEMKKKVKIKLLKEEV